LHSLYPDGSPTLDIPHLWTSLSSSNPSVGLQPLLADVETFLRSTPHANHGLPTILVRGGPGDGKSRLQADIAIAAIRSGYFIYHLAGPTYAAYRNDLTNLISSVTSLPSSIQLMVICEAPNWNDAGSLVDAI